MQIIRLALIGLMLLMAGCNSSRIAELESENIQLKASAAQYDHENALELAKWELAASTYNGCLSLAGFGSFLCPRSAMIFGETAVTKGIAGAGARYWLIIISKLTVIIGAIFSILFTGWFLYVKKVLPEKSNIDHALKIVNEAETNAEKAKIEEVKLLASMTEIEQNLIKLKEMKNEALSEYHAILRKKQEIEVMAKAMKAFD